MKKVCKAKAINPSKYSVKGEAQRYLMASEFGFDPPEQSLINPDINVNIYCDDKGKELCRDTLKIGQNILFTCNG